MRHPVACCAALFCFTCAAQEEPTVHFGTTVVISTGLRGDIYFIPDQSQWLPNFKKLKPVGAIYATELNVPRQSFTVGFPGVTGRFEWFAIDYTGNFWIENPGKYTFALMSDDGSKLYIDGHQKIDNDGIHAARGYAAIVKLKKGPHTIRVSYFQGPRTAVALILAVARPGEDELSLFNTEDYLPPHDLEELKKIKPDYPKTAEEWKLKRRPAEPLEMPEKERPNRY